MVGQFFGLAARGWALARVTSRRERRRARERERGREREREERERERWGPLPIRKAKVGYHTQVEWRVNRPYQNGLGGLRFAHPCSVAELSTAGLPPAGYRQFQVLSRCRGGLLLRFRERGREGCPRGETSIPPPLRYRFLARPCEKL